MVKILRFKKEPSLTDLAGLKVNGASFENGESFIERTPTIIMSIPNVFRFHTQLEVFQGKDGNIDLILTQLLTRWPELWEMEEAFGRISFRNPEIEEQLRSLCDELINRGLVEWVVHD